MTQEVDARSVLESVAPALVSGQRIGVAVQDHTGQILDFNDAALASLSMTADQLLGRSSLDGRWEALDESGRPMPGERHPAMVALTTGEPQFGVTMGVRDGTGQLRWLMVDSVLFDHPDHGRIAVTQFVDRTAEFAARARTAEALDRLQRHVLPTTEVDLPWLAVEHRYEAVTPPLDVGGDFLDVFELDDGSVAFFIGDVAGHDLDAVATMVIARHTLRAAGLHLRQPDRVLRWLHDTLSATPDTVFCTAVFGTVSLTPDGDPLVRFASGGHPAPLLVRQAGSVEVLSEHGRLIGAPTSWSEPPIVEVVMRPGDQLLMYTDGLLDNQQPRFTDEQLHERLRSSNQPVAAVVDQLLASGDAAHSDDSAAIILTARHS